MRHAVLAENRLFSGQTSSTVCFPQCFPHLWKSWGRNRRCFRPPFLRAPGTVAQSGGFGSDPLTVQVAATTIEISSGGPEALGTLGPQKNDEGKAHISAQRPPSEEDPRLPRAHGNEERPDRFEAAPGQGPQAPHSCRRALIDAARPRTGARRAGPPSARFRTRIHDRSPYTRAFHDAVRRRQRWDVVPFGCGGDEKTWVGGRTKSRKTVGARGLQTTQDPRRPRYCDRATPGNARCFVRYP